MDNYVLEDGSVIYPIVKMKHNNKDYLFYSIKSKNITIEDIYIAEEVNKELLPVDDKTLNELVEKFKELNFKK